MNYIHQLKREKAVDKAELSDLYQSLDLLRMHLHSDKYVGTDSNGHSKEWIATADALRRISEIIESARIAGDDAAREFDRIQAAKPTLHRTEAA